MEIYPPSEYEEGAIYLNRIDSSGVTQMLSFIGWILENVISQESDMGAKVHVKLSWREGAFMVEVIE